MNSVAENDDRHYPAAILRGVILLQCLGLFGLYYAGSNETESDIFGLLYFDWALPEPVAQSIDDSGVLATAFCGAMIALIGWTRIRFGATAGGPVASGRELLRWARWIDHASILFVAGWFLALAIAHQLRGGPYAHLALGEHAVRYVAPLALLLCIVPVRESSLGRHWGSPVVWILRIAAAATFATHGYKAIESYGHFLDLILLSELRWTSWQISEQTTTSLLTVIGWIDLLFAAIVLTRWWPAAAVYMMLWGLITAVSRMTALGTDYWPSTLLRAANSGVPMALLASYWFYQRQLSPPLSLTEETR